MQKLLYFRKLSQIFILLLFILVPLLNMYEIYNIRGNLLAFSFFEIALIDPFSAFQAILGILRNSFSSNISIFASIPSDIWLGMGLILVLAFSLGAVFCSWLCPYGFFSEIAHKVAIKKGKREDTKEYKKAYYFKYILFIALCIIVFVFKTGPIGNLLSMPAWYTKIVQYIFLYGQILFLPLFFMLIVLGFEMYMQKRIWCLYICPQSVFISLFSKFSPLSMRIKFLAKSCTCSANERACIKACSLQLNARNLEKERILCTNCGDCIKACANSCKNADKALSFGFKKN